MHRMKLKTGLMPGSPTVGLEESSFTPRVSERQSRRFPEAKPWITFMSWVALRGHEPGSHV